MNAHTWWPLSSLDAMRSAWLVQVCVTVEAVNEVQLVSERASSDCAVAEFDDGELRSSGYGRSNELVQHFSMEY